MLAKLIINDIFKQKRSWLLLMVIAIPVFTSLLLVADFSIRYKAYLQPLTVKKGITSWQMLVLEQNMLYFKEFLPLFGAMVIAALFDAEYKNNGWVLEMTYPVPRSLIILSKYITGLIYMFIMLLTNVITLLAAGWFIGFKEKVSAEYFIKMFLIQLAAVTAVMVIHLFITIKDKNTLKSISIAGVLCFISSNLFYTGSSISKYNPYSFASYSSARMKPDLTLLFLISGAITIGGLIYIITYFNRSKEY